MPDSPTTETLPRGLAPFTSSSQPGEQYYDHSTGHVWKVIGWITQPAAILANLATGERHIEIIGCPNAERFQRVEIDQGWIVPAARKEQP